MPAPAMPATMRGDGRGTRVRPRTRVVRHFAGKGDDTQRSDSDEEDDNNHREDDEGEEEDEENEEEEEEEEEEEGGGSRRVRRADTALPAVRISQADLARHFSASEQHESERLLREAVAEEEEDAESDGRYETDDAESGDESDESEEETAPRRVLLKPTFLTKSQREANGSATIATTTTTTAVAPVKNGKDHGDDDDDDDDVLEVQRQKRLEARELLQHSIRQASHAADSGNRGAVDDEGDAAVDDTDDPAQADADKTAWKVRELKRMVRDRDSLVAREREREARDARRAVPEEQRLREDIERVRLEAEEKRAAKREEREEGTTTTTTNNNNDANSMGGGGSHHHHRGGFYQDDPITTRRLVGKLEDTGAGAGLKGATRRRDEDTTARDSVWSDGRDAGVKRTVERMGGMRDVFDQTRTKKKKKF